MYVQSENGLKEVFLGGDQLTCERVRSAKMARLQTPDAVQRLEGLLPKVEDWHALQAFYQVIWIALYSTSSSRDKGTLYQLHSLIAKECCSLSKKGSACMPEFSICSTRSTDWYLQPSTTSHH